MKALELQQAKTQQRDDREVSVVFADPDHGFSIASTDGTYRLRIWGYVHGEARLYLSDDEVPLANTFVLRRARIVAEGSVGQFDFRVMPEFSNGGGLLDAYVAASVRSWFKVRAGRGKVPIGLEFLQSDTVTMFIERAYPSQLVPNRDNGAQVTGDLAGGALSYAVGIYNGAADGASRDSDNTDDKDGVARLFATPFRGGAPGLAGLSFGVGGSYGNDDGIATPTTVSSSGLSSYKSPGQATIFAYRSPATGGNVTNTTIADGSHWRLAPQIYYHWGPFSAMGECTCSVQEVSFAGNRSTLAHQAWQGSIGYVLTGEDAAFKGVSPASPLHFEGSGWGALELVARVHRLDLDEDAFLGGNSSPADPTRSVERATSFAVGINWYLTGQTKVKIDYEYTTFSGGALVVGGVSDREDEQVISTQVQLTF